VDSMLVLKRDTYGGYVLHGKGRDLIEVEKAMEFDRNACIWRMAGDAAPVRQSRQRTAILHAIEDAGEPVGPHDIAAAPKTKATNVRFLLGKLVREGAIEKVERGRYCPTGAKQSEPPKEAPKPKSRFRIIDTCEDNTICVKCGQPGDVKRIKDATKPGSQSETLHEACAPAWFEAA